MSVSVRTSLELFIEVLNLNNFKRITVFGSLCFNFVIHDLKSCTLYKCFDQNYFSFHCKLDNVVNNL